MGSLPRSSAIAVCVFHHARRVIKDLCHPWLVRPRSFTSFQLSYVELFVSDIYLNWSVLPLHRSHRKNHSYLLLRSRQVSIDGVRLQFPERPECNSLRRRVQSHCQLYATAHSNFTVYGRELFPRAPSLLRHRSPGTGVQDGTLQK